MSTALYFDGINDYTALGDLGLFEDKAAGLVGWLYLPDAVGTHVVFSEYDSAGADYVTLSVTAAALTAAAHDGTDTTSLSGGTLLPEAWHHVALVADATDLLIYLDGVVVDSAALPAGAITLDTAMLGRDKAGNYLFGALNQVRCYSTATLLTPTEILADYEAGMEPEETPPELVTPTLDELVRLPYQRVVSTCTAYLSGELVTTLPLAGGSVTADARRARLRDATLAFAASEESDADALFAVLTTPGIELALARGFETVDGTRVMAELGRFVVLEAEVQKTAKGSSVAATCADLSARIARARWTDAYQIASGTVLAEALTDILTDRWPDVRTAITGEDAPETMGTGFISEDGSESDPWADAQKLAQAYGYELYFDAQGVARVRSQAELATAAPRFTFEAGEAQIRLEETRQSPLERTYNGVIATGEGSEIEVPVRGEAWDDNASSPTYRYGPFGMVPRFYSSPFITTVDQAETAAESILAPCLGRVEQLTWTQLVHPGLEPLDVVAVTSASGAVAIHILDALTIPLGHSEAMGATAREVVRSA